MAGRVRRNLRPRTLGPHTPAPPAIPDDSAQPELQRVDSHGDAGSGASPAAEPASQAPAAHICKPSQQSLHDIYHVAFLLRQRLCPDLVPAILNHAEYWLCHSTRLNKSISVMQHSSPQLLLRTPPINPPVRLKNPIRKVAFSISSHDQGWCSDGNGGSWTWFEASIAPSAPEDQEIYPMIVSPREVARNKIGEKTMQEHAVQWPRVVAGNDEEEEERRRSDLSWVERLHRGDAVALQAFARFAGWENYVADARIDVYTAAVV